MPFVLMLVAEQTLKLGVITPMMMLSSILMIFLTSPSLAWIVAFSVPFLAVVVLYVAVKTRPLSEKQQKTLDKINQYVRENLMGLRVIRAFAREDFQENRFEEKNAIYADNSNRLFKLTGLTEPLFCANHYCHDCSYRLVCSRSSQARKFADWGFGSLHRV